MFGGAQLARANGLPGRLSPHLALEQEIDFVVHLRVLNFHALKARLVGGDSFSGFTEVTAEAVLKLGHHNHRVLQLFARDLERFDSMLHVTLPLAAAVRFRRRFRLTVSRPGYNKLHRVLPAT